MKEYFKILREISKNKREYNRRSGAFHLKNAGIVFESKNDGTHLIVVGV